MLQKVMVVNDNELLLMIAKKVIAISHFAQETITATDGLQALAYFDNLLEQKGHSAMDEPEFMFLDLHMPGMDGWEFLEIFTEKYQTYFPKLKIAILSASVDMTDMLMLVKYPIVVDFINTAIDETVLNNIQTKFFSGVPANA
jgi:CheY-like chemotaxis protein